MSPPDAVWFVLLLFLLARPAAVWLGLLGATSVSRDQRILISWFGIRGVGSIFYLMYAINHGLPAAFGGAADRDHAHDGRRIGRAPRHLGDAADEPVRKPEDARSRVAAQRGFLHFTPLAAHCVVPRWSAAGPLP